MYSNTNQLIMEVIGENIFRCACYSVLWVLCIYKSNWFWYSSWSCFNTIYLVADCARNPTRVSDGDTSPTLWKVTMKTLLISICIFLSARQTHPKQDVVYMSEWNSTYNKSVLNQCKMEVAMLVFYNVDYNYVTDEQGQAFSRFLMDSCVKHYRISI